MGCVMPSLLERCKTVRAGLDRANLANETRREMAALSSRAKEWGDRLSRHRQVRERQRWLPLVPEVMDAVESANAMVMPLAKEAAARLAAEGVHGLSKDDLWVRLLNSAEGATKVTEEALREGWREQVESLGEVTGPAVLERQVSPTASNKEVLEEYKRAYDRYRNTAKAGLPSDPSALSVLKDAVATLRLVHARLNFSGSNEVKQFLSAVDQGGASLLLLTPAVLQWLQENDDISRFIVKTRSAR